jgi:hypothetical protein
VEVEEEVEVTAPLLSALQRLLCLLLMLVQRRQLKEKERAAS